MVGDMPADFGEGSSSGQPAAQWAPPFPTQTPQRPRSWPAVGLALIAVVVAVAALIFALTNSKPAAPPPTPAVPAFTAAQTAAAQKQLCDTYRLAAQAAQ